MVVNRKTPVAPAPPASRSNSSQPLPRAVKAKNVPLPPTPVPAASSHDNRSKSKQRQQKKKEKPRQGSSIAARLFLLLLGVFALYSATICRTDHPRTSPICRTLDVYRTYILDPYILPPLHRLAHRTAPHVAPLKPYVEPVADFTRTQVIPRVSTVTSLTHAQYTKYVVPAFHRYVVPAYQYYVVDQYYNGILKPIYLKGIQPYVYPHIRPYILFYHKIIVPFAHRTYEKVDAAYRHVRPHVLHYAAQARSAAYSAYRTAEPYGIEAWARVQPHVAALWEQIKVHALQIAKVAGDARREYVDPHVRRIWDKVIEAEVVSSFKATTAEVTQATADEPTTSLVADPVPSSVSTTPATAAVPEPTVTPEEETPTDITPPPTPIVEAVLPSSPSPIPSTEEASAFAESVVAASLHPDFVGVAASSSPSPPGDVEEEGMDDFLKEIGLDEQIPGSAPEITEPEPETPAPAEEGLTPEQRLAETAAKRAEITKRHAAWQDELDALVREMTEHVKGGVRGVREAAVAELKTGDKAKRVIGDVEGEAGKLVKGLEGYFKKLGGGEGEKEKEKWQKVLERVEEKFADKVKDVQRDVHAWYLSVREKEVDEVNNAAAAVKALAERAQGDIGLDYAWLDDVTYLDWQRYHDLMRSTCLFLSPSPLDINTIPTLVASENFTALASFLQSGDRTHLKAPSEAPEPVADPLVHALDELEREVNEVVEGFAVVLNGVRRRAAEVFRVKPDASDAEGSGKEKEDEEPRVSILPISPTTPGPGKGGKEEVEKVDVDHLFVGRGKEEVEANLRGVELENVSQSGVRDEL
ncbi:hypothetical protein Hypma_003644 [Hypsizygus marmoreus]|uniref:Uncharacterized protein n=1 Tax=Hypsizygus marmoreus TaxID=39966 RepID=A0A369J3T0_HYPMA|nr:hypothetical protein Hypma_003644 [Hypsizygus marmoreus]